jgi:hypothetical protein
MALCKRKQSTLCIATREMDARTAYESFLRKRVSDTHWSSVKRTLADSGMEVNPDTVVFFAKLRKEIPRSSVGILQVFDCYQQAEKLLAANSSKIKGHQILEILNREGIAPHPATISRWFKSLGGFRKTRYYYPEKLTKVLTSAFIYKIANCTKIGA